MKKFIEPEIDLMKLDVADVITTSHCPNELPR